MSKLVNLGLVMLVLTVVVGCAGSSSTESTPKPPTGADTGTSPAPSSVALDKATLDAAGLTERWQLQLNNVVVKQAVVMQKELLLTLERRDGETVLHEMVAFDRTSGAFRYQGLMPAAATTPPTENQRYVFLFCGRTLVGYDKQIQGKLYLKAQQRIVPEGQPRCDDDFVFVMGNDNRIYWINIRNPEKRDNIDWDSYRFLGTVLTEPLLHKERLYLGTEDGKVVVVNTNTRKFEWEYKTDGSITADIAGVRDTILVGSHDAKLYRLRHTKGIDRRTQETWVLPYQAGSAIVDGPVVSGNLAFIQTDKTGFHAVKLEDGTRAWMVDDRLSVLSRGVEAVHLLATDGTVLALNAETGAKLWTLPTRGFAYKPQATDTGDLYLVTRDGFIQVLTQK